MALSAEQSDKILVDLAQHILENGGVITSEKLGAFYAKNPAHRSLVKNMRSFCEQHPDRIAIEATEGPHYSLKIAVLKEDKVVDLLRTFMQKRNGTATLADLEGFSTRHPSCGKAIHSGGDPCSFNHIYVICIHEHATCIHMFFQRFSPIKGSFCARQPILRFG